MAQRVGFGAGVAGEHPYAIGVEIGRRGGKRGPQRGVGGDPHDRGGGQLRAQALVAIQGRSELAGGGRIKHDDPIGGGRLVGDGKESLDEPVVEAIGIQNDSDGRG